MAFREVYVVNYFKIRHILLISAKLSWICNILGTTLGLLRHHGLIPWDDDLDLCILEENELIFTEIIAPILKNQYCICTVPANTFGYRIYHMFDSEELENSDLLNYRYPFCDIFVMKIHKKKCFIRERIGRTLWPKEKYQICDIEKPIPKLFGNFYLMCPNNPEKYLDKTYGENWSKTGETPNYCHITRESKSSVEFDIISYEPAKPFE